MYTYKVEKSMKKMQKKTGTTILLIIIFLILAGLGYYFGYKIGTKLADKKTSSTTKETTTTNNLEEFDSAIVSAFINNNLQNDFNKKYEVTMQNTKSILNITNVTTLNQNDNKIKDYSLIFKIDGKQIYTFNCTDFGDGCGYSFNRIDLFNKSKVFISLIDKRSNGYRLSIENGHFIDSAGSDTIINSYYLSDKSYQINFTNDTINYLANVNGEVLLDSESIDVYKYSSKLGEQSIKGDLYGKVDTVMGELQ
jgi:hypothetical protein